MSLIFVSNFAAAIMKNIEKLPDDKKDEAYKLAGGALLRGLAAMQGKSVEDAEKADAEGQKQAPVEH